MQESDKKEAEFQARFVLEHIHQVFLGEEVPITTAFNQYAIARVVRVGGRTDYVVVKWDFHLYVPKVVFDPNCGKGTIQSLQCLYVYDKVDVPTPAPPPKKTEQLFTRRPDEMTGDALYAELELIHGLSKEQCKQYRSMPARMAKVTEMRRIMDLTKEV
jgi:hypothetical protein